MRITLSEIRALIREIDHMDEHQPKFAVGGIVTDQWGDCVGRISAIRWDAIRDEHQYTIVPVPPYPQFEKPVVSKLESYLVEFEKPMDFDERVRQETLHPMLRGWGKDVG